MHADSGNGRSPADQASLVVEVFRMLTDATRMQVLWSLTDHVRQLVIDAVFNAEHAGPGVPGHHRDDSELKAVTKPSSPNRQRSGTG
jgi:hypothetical protein